MSNNNNYIDISQFQPASIDWNAYKVWSAAGDGVSRVAIKSSEGVGFKDRYFDAHRAGALSAGINVIIAYHFARPDLGNSPQSEADWQQKVVGGIRTSDMLMLDLEVNGDTHTAQWAYEWLLKQESGFPGHAPTLYASDSYIREHLQDRRLARFPLTLAHWTFDASARPACPPPWNHYDYLQYTDKLINVPGVHASVDADVFVGAEPVVVQPPQPPVVGRIYTIAEGDNLWNLAIRFNSSVDKLYNENAEVIESTAHQHGLHNSEHGKWIFPKTILKIP